MSDVLELEPQIYPTHRRRHSRKIIRAVSAGTVTAMLGALLWAAAMTLMHHRIGLLAVGLGFAVGTAVRLFGRGRTDLFGVIAMLCSTGGCLLGDILGGLILSAEARHVAVSYVLQHASMETIRVVVYGVFTPMDALYYLVALFISFKYAVLVENYY